MSSKNILQEYCQKNKLDFPIYETYRIDGTDNLPIFECSINFLNKIYKSTGNSKICAEKNAASIVCNEIVNNHQIKFSNSEIKKENVIRNNVFYTLSQKYSNILEILDELFENIYLIDGDNCHIMNEDVFNDQKSLFIYFVAKNNTKIQPIIHQQKYENCCIFISKSIGKDAVDHLMSYYLGKMSMIWLNKKYFILTKDHFGECLEKNHENCYLICSL